MKFKWAAIAAVLTLVAGCHKTDWQTFAPPGGNFSVQIPGVPEDKSQTRTTPGGSVTSHLYIYTTKDAAFAVNYVDRPAPKTAAETEQWFDRLRDAEMARAGGKLLGEAPIKLANTWPGREIRISMTEGDGKHAMRSRMYLVNSRLYQVLVILPQDELSSPDAEKFLDSFHLQ